MNLENVYNIIDKKVVSLFDLEQLRNSKNVLKVSLSMVTGDYDMYTVQVLNEFLEIDYYIVYNLGV